MELSTLIGFAVFAMTAAMTPGPNNIMLTSSGATFGFRRTIPHMVGIAVGFSILATAGGFGLATLFAFMPLLFPVMKIISIGFLLYLAWKIANSGRVGKQEAAAPLTLWQAAAFQIVNPKTMAVIISAVSTYTSGVENLTIEVTQIVLIFLIATVCSTSTWCLFGAAIGRLLTKETHLKLFNRLMALLLLGSMFPILTT